MTMKSLNVSRAVVSLSLCLTFAAYGYGQQPTPPPATQTSQSIAIPPPQPPVVRRGTIRGRILGDDGQPLADVPVVASAVGRSAAMGRPGFGGPAGAPSQTTTDEEGNFIFENLTPASYSIAATVPGYIAPPAEEETGSGFYHLGDTANITLIKGGVITGKVVNASGEALVGVSVNALRLGNLNGEEDENVQPAGIGPGQALPRSWRTDDRGVYRIYGLIPGTYIVQAGPPANGPGGFGPNPFSPYSGDAPTFYPSAVRDAAVHVAVQPGGELSGIDIRYRGEKGHAVSGKTLAKAEAAPSGFVNGFNATVVSLNIPGTDNIVATAVQMNGGPGGRGFGRRANQVTEDGFALYGVPDGEYEISARRNGFGAESDFIAAPRHISVHGADVGGLQLTLAPLASVSGRVVMERRPGICPSPRRAFMEEVLLSAERDDASSHEMLNGRQRPSAPLGTGDFTLRNLEAGRWRIAAQLPDESWYLRAITAEIKPPVAATRRTAAATAATTQVNAGRAGLALKAGEKQSGLVIAITEGAALLQGKLVNEAGKVIGKTHVHLIPAEKEAADDVLRYAETLTASDGSFHFKNLAPGRYLLLGKSAKPPAAGSKIVRPLAWDNAQRASLRREAEAAGNLVELKTCQQLNEYKLVLK